MMIKKITHKLLKKLIFLTFILRNIFKEKFQCPICGYKGPFEDINPSTGLRKHARCFKCKALERHRIQYLVINEILKDKIYLELKMLHIAPEPFLKKFFINRFKHYETTDLNMHGVDYKVDITKLPFKDATYDFVFASHVMEHIQDDEKALSEIRRILKPGGMAVLPVPLVAEKTVEYAKPNPNESDHVRAPGYDYFDKYEQYFSRLEKFRSDFFSIHKSIVYL